MSNSENLSPLVESTLTPAPSSADDISMAEKPARRAVAYIEPPLLAPAERVKYEAVSSRDLPQDFDFILPLSDRVIVGEYRDDTTLWYYVENADGVAHRFESTAFAEAFPYSVSEFKHRKKIGALATFDPFASNVHPDSRPKVFIRIPSKKIRRLNKLSKQRALSVESSSDEEWQRDIAEEDDVSDLTDDDDIRSVALSPPRRNTRRSTVKSGQGRPDLPFSPRMTRLHKRTLTEDESSETSASDRVRPIRRSNRVRNSVRTNHDYEDGESDSLSDEHASPVRNSVSKAKVNVPKRGKASRPAYGHIRSIVDLEYDEIENGPLSAHRHTCERCQRKPTHILLDQQRKPGKRNNVTRRPRDEFKDASDSEDKLSALGGWVRCMKCTLAAHWRCLASTQRDEILRAVQERDLIALNTMRGKNVTDARNTAVDGNKSKVPQMDIPPKRPGLESYQTTEFICSMCSKGGICMICKSVAIEPDSTGARKAEDHVPPFDSATVAVRDPASLDGTDAISEHQPPIGSQTKDTAIPSKEILFRCRLCKRIAHYAHLPPPDGVIKGAAEETVEAIAQHYQRNQEWSCTDCVSFVYSSEKILAWRPYPANAPQPELPPGESFNPKMLLPREYLVKWQGRSYRRVQWVPHGWLASVSAGLLRNFLLHGPKVELLEHAVREDQVSNAVSEGGIGGSSKESEGSLSRAVDHSEGVALLPSLDAERRIPPAWKTVDRVLDILMWFPREKRKSSTEASADTQREWNEAFEFGQVPSAQNTMTLDEWEAQKKDGLSVDDIDHVVWAFIKWDDLGYDEATWDSPPRKGEPGHLAFEVAFGRFLASRKVHIRLRSKREIASFEARRKDEFRQRHALKQGRQPDLGQQEQLKLMPFQIDGFNWLCDNWWNHQPCILADEMGLGKTVQIATSIGYIIKAFDAAPVLVVVPQSTITNWAREFASWTPGIRVVPFYGEAKSREVIKRYELQHPTKMQGTTGAKYHVLITTYDTITSKDFHTVIKNVHRWEVLIVDEGQRLKNDHSVLFKKLNELKVSHRVIMTGTPLNNNIRELFNLMNFLDPNEWGDLERLEKDHTELTEELVKELHIRLRPYFLRRLKGQVLQLPPKNEVIVPVSLTPLQKEVYKSVLGKNVEILKMLTSTSNDDQKSSKKPRISSMNNILMELRKCIQHPYLVSHDIEPKGLSSLESHSRLVAGSAKLRLLQALLPKLRARGHRFVVALDVVEDFLDGEGFKYLRLDGNTKQSERQKGMDEFNRPGSDVFMYLLSTRAGGVGINLWSADTVIIFDPDFNPHQAIARAHRYGQTKPCLVFKLMAKDTAEERIIQTGKKKLVLDHVIVQKMDDFEGGGDVQSILTYGARTLFDETVASRDISYSDQDLDKLIEKTETEEAPPEETGEDSGQVFSFAKVWTAENDTLEELEDQAYDAEATDSWAHALQLIAKEQGQMKVTERTGRGVRRKAAIAAENQQKLNFLGTPVKDNPRGKKRKKSRATTSEESDAYVNIDPSLSESSGNEAPGDEVTQIMSELGVPVMQGSGMLTSLPKKQLLPASTSDPWLTPRHTQHSGPTVLVFPVMERSEMPTRLSKRQPIPAPTSGFIGQSTSTHVQHSGGGLSAHSQEIDICAMCGNAHQGTCGMTEHSENLVQYRQILITNQTEEPFEERRDAIAMIDDTLKKRGQLHLIYDQPLRLVEKSKRWVSGSAKVVTSTTQTVPLTSSSRPKNTVDQRVLQRGVGYANSPASSSSARGGSTATATATLPKRRSDTPNRTAKKPKTDSHLGCPICGGPHHLIKDCPVTAEGPKSIHAAISRLESQSGQTATVVALREVLRRSEKRALGQIPG
ncbi:SNF2 family N-terminal domain-containing protein [Russula earlei]|uniref:SNF2 family N-terminal domain-containing protein n=1 Tax=Russula earlei TaxID=71964 RepID=A0ACC0UN60_9AGAM|nr:SNF2 family N-terminal domain-containing protein [Russula earlei]